MARRRKPRGDYAVGYGRPPKHTRFKPGHSGNPKGRPKGVLNIKSDLDAELKQRIRVREGDQILTISKQRAYIKSVLTRSLKGDARAANTLLALMARTRNFEAVLDELAQPLSEEDREILNAYEARLLRRQADSSDDEDA